MNAGIMVTWWRRLHHHQLITLPFGSRGHSVLRGQGASTGVAAQLVVVVLVAVVVVVAGMVQEVAGVVPQGGAHHARIHAGRPKGIEQCAMWLHPLQLLLLLQQRMDCQSKGRMKARRSWSGASNSSSSSSERCLLLPQCVLPGHEQPATPPAPTVAMMTLPTATTVQHWSSTLVTQGHHLLLLPCHD